MWSGIQLFGRSEEMSRKTFWKVNWDGVRMLHTWGNPTPLIFEAVGGLWKRRKTIHMNPVDGLDMADRIFQVYGFGGDTPDWRKRFPDEFPNRQ
jgi:hypothetical protein